MTDEPEIMPVKSGKKANQTSFKPGFDKRRWLKGRAPKSPEQREGEKILRAVYWKELSREFDAASGKPLEPEETLTALELAVRTQIKKDFRSIADRIAGKVTERVDLSNSDGTLKPPQIIEIVKSYEKTDDATD